MTARNGKIVDWVFKIMSILVVPIIIWGVRLEVNQAVLGTQHANMSAQIVTVKSDFNHKTSKIETDLKEGLAAANAASEAVRMGMQENKVTLGRMEGKLDGIDRSIDEIKSLLRDIH